MKVLRSLDLVAALALTLVASASGAAPQLMAPQTTPRIDRLERWIETVLEHQPGEAGSGIAAIGSWRNRDLLTVGFDVRALVQLIRDPLRDRFAFKVDDHRSAAPARYTPVELRRLKQLACGVGGVSRWSACAALQTSIELDPDLKRLSESASAVRVGNDDNFILRRGALLHSDIAILNLASPEPVSTESPVTSQALRIGLADGHETDLTVSDAHWEIARLLLDEVKSAGAPKPGPERDDMVLRWYRATATWMQYHGQHDTIHLNRGREIFPDDADLQFLTGTQHETYGGAFIQAAARSAVLPTGVTFAVSSERLELREAERYFRRAVELNADLAEGHLRLGRVLARLGHPAEAATELRKSLESTTEPLLEYYGDLFLGAVEETLGHDADAKASYQRAVTLYPRAQSPRVALSELARRSGDREGALRAIQDVFLLPPRARDADPWWTYHTAQGRRTDALLDDLRRPFLMGGTP